MDKITIEMNFPLPAPTNKFSIFERMQHISDDIAFYSLDAKIEVHGNEEPDLFIRVQDTNTGCEDDFYYRRDG